MQSLFISIILFFSGLVTVMGQTVSRAVIWRGFEHSWTYNHRINRVGDFVALQGDSVSIGHTSASGVGPDSTYFTNHYSLIEADNVHFFQGVESLKIYGKEKHLITKEVEIAVPVPSHFHAQDKYTVVLNGFDLQAIGRADKLQLLRISVEDAKYASAVHELRFRLKVAIVVNCQSFECSRFSQKTTYDMKVHYLIIAGDDEYFTSTSTTYTKSYPWTKKYESQSLPEKAMIYGKANHYEQATLGVKSIAITLDNAHWMVQYECNATPLSYTVENGSMEFSLDLFFKEWIQGMKQMSATPGASAFSSKKRGWCVLDVDVCLLQFQNADIRHQKHSGALHWPGHNAPPTDTKAWYEKKVPFAQ